MASAMENIAKSLGVATRVCVGFMEGATAGWNGPRPKGPMKGKRKKSDNSKGGSVPAAYVAFVLEHGNPKNGMPPRPFFTDMIAKQSPTWGKLVAAALKMHNYNAHSALEVVGLKVKEQLQDSINNFSGEANKPSTQARKQFSGGDKTLIDSHNMINAIDYRVD